MTIYSLDVLLSQFWTSPLFHVQFFVTSCPAYIFLRSQVRWPGIPISLRIFHSLLSSTQSKEEKQMLFWNSLAFSTIRHILVLWSLVPLPFLNPGCTSGSSQFMYCWSLAWRIFSITLLACEMNAIVRWSEHSLALSFFGMGMKMDLFHSCHHCWVFQIC